MKAADIRDALLHQPSQPSLLRLTDGSSILVPHPDFLVFFGPKAGVNLGVFTKPEGGLKILDLDQVVMVEIPAPQS